MNLKFVSFQISNRVTEFHYSDSESCDGRAHDYHEHNHNNEAFINDDNDDHRDFCKPEPENCGDHQIQLPPPVYPTLNGSSKKSWNKLADKKSTFTKDQIIDLYCASTSDR